jgi:outer membrane autotransporter protein
MKKKLPKLIKNLLATTSALTIAVGAQEFALAVPRTSINPVSSISNNADWSPFGFDAGDSIIYGGNHSIDVNNLGYFTIGAVDTANQPLVGNLVVSNSHLILGGAASSGSGTGVDLILQNAGYLIIDTVLGTPVGFSNNYSKLQSLDFNGNGSTVTIQNGHTLTLPTNFTSSGVTGTIIVDNLGTVTFNGNFDTVSKVNNILIQPNSSGIFNKDVSLINSIEINSGEAAFGPNVTINVSSIVEQVTGGTGQITFQGNATINAPVGGTSSAPGSAILNKANIGAGQVTFTDRSFSVLNTYFTDPNASFKVENTTAFAKYGTILNTSFNNTSGVDGTGNFEISSYTELHGILGKGGASLNNVNFNNDSILQIFSDQIYLKTMTTSNDGQGSLVIRSDNDKYIDFDIGSSSKKLNNIVPTMDSFAAPTPITRTTLKSGRSIHANEFKLYPGIEIYSPSDYVYAYPIDTSIFTLENDTLINAPITTLNSTDPSSNPFVTYGNPSFGTVRYSEVNVLASSTILKDIGTNANRMNLVNFSGTNGNIVNLSGDVHSQAITIAQPNIVLGKNITLEGQVASNSTTYSLGTNILNFISTKDIATPVTSTITGNPTVNTTVTDFNHGYFLVSGGNLDMSAINSLTLNLRDNADILPPTPNGQSYVIFGTVNNNGTILVLSDSKASFHVIDQNPFVTWSYTNGIATRKRLPQDQINDIINGVITGGGGSQTAVDNSIKLADPNNISDAAAIFQNLVTVILNPSDDLVASINSLQTSIVEASEQVSEAIDQLFTTIGERLTSASVPSFGLAQGDDTSGMAAGDEVYHNGVWASASYGTATQGKRGESPGFKSQTVGFLVGVDTMITDDDTVGMAISYTENKVKHKSANEGDRSKIKTYTISLYGMQYLNDKWFVQGIGLFSRNHVVNNEIRRPGNGRIEIAKGDFNVNAYGVEALLGYDYLISDKLLLVPTIGAEYLRLANSRYKESGTTNQNLLITKEKDDKLIAIIGASLAYKADFKTYTLIPEVHAGLTHNMLKKTPSVTAQVAGLVGDRLINKTAVESKTYYSFGCNLGMSKGMTELSAGYDLFLGNKYVGHQGSLKARINF